MLCPVVMSHNFHTEVVMKLSYPTRHEAAVRDLSSRVGAGMSRGIRVTRCRACCQLGSEREAAFGDWKNVHRRLHAGAKVVLSKGSFVIWPQITTMNT